MFVKKIIIDNVRLSYNGPFDIYEFIESIEDWKERNGFEKEIKRHLEHTEPEGKKVEWLIEYWKDLRDYARIVIRLRTLCVNLKEVEIKQGKSKRTYNKGEVLVLIDGILVQDVYGRWQQKPTFYFLRAMVDKYFYKFHMHKFEADTEGYVHELHKHLKAFFESQRSKILESSDERHIPASMVPV